MYTLGAGRILIKSIIIVCLLNLFAWKASWAHRTGENEKKNDKIKKSVQTSSACGLTNKPNIIHCNSYYIYGKFHVHSIKLYKVDFANATMMSLGFVKLSMHLKYPYTFENLNEQLG